MTDWKEQLKHALEGVMSGGKFAVTGTFNGPLPEMAVRGVGKLAFPIDAQQAADLVFAGLPAPYGKGSDTVLDAAVRKAIQIQPDRVRFSADWDETVRRLATDAAAALGLPGGGGAAVEARLYKLLVYEPGGHFKAHRDTEKEPGMFGTLLIQLPVAGGHTGGRLTVWHAGQEDAWDTAAAGAAAGAGAAAAGAGADSADEATLAAAAGGGSSSGGVGGGDGGGGAPQPALHYAAFYADCEHQLFEVTSGLRVVLSYNLVRVGQQQLLAPAGGAPPAGMAASTTPAAQQDCPQASRADAITTAVRAWEAAGVAAQPLVTIPLAHRYTEANLSFGGLKGMDAVKVQALLDCPLLDVHLVLFTREVEGSAREYYSDPEDFEQAGMTATFDNVGDDITQVKLWISPLFGQLKYDDDFGLRLGSCMLKESQPLFAGGPDKGEYEPYTGNDGPSLKQWYHRALVVAWPRSRRWQLWAVPGSADDAVTVARLRLREAAATTAAATAAAAAAAGGDGGRRAPRQLPLMAQMTIDAVPYQDYELQEYLLRLEKRLPHVLDEARTLEMARQALQTALECAVEKMSAVWASNTMAKQALELLSCEQAARLCGEPWREQACVRLVRSMAEAARLPHLDEQAVQEALASTAAALRSDTFDSAVVELVARQAPRQLQGCYQLTTQKALPAALRDRAAQAFHMAVFGTAAAVVDAGVVAAAVGSASACASAPALQAASPASSECLANLHPEDVIYLAGLVFAAEGADAAAAPFSGMAGAFAAAVLQRPDCQEKGLLPALLQTPAVRAALAVRPPVAAAVQLAQARVAHLEPRVLKGRLKDDFSVHDAYCRDPKVQDFLRSPEQERVFSGFGSRWEAETWAADVAPAYQQPRKFQAVAAIGEDGHTHVVRVTKDPAYVDGVKARAQEAEAKELAELQQALLQGPNS